MPRTTRASEGPASTNPARTATGVVTTAAIVLLTAPWSPVVPDGILVPQPTLDPVTMPALLLILALTPALALYRRITREGVLGNGTRRTLLAELRKEPGATVGALSERMDLDYKTVEHHVRILGVLGLAHPRRDGRLRRWYPAGTAPRRREGPLAAAPSTALDLLRLVLDEPGIPQAEVARRLDLAPSTVRWHVGNLVEAGVLEDPRGRVGLSLAPDAGWVREALPDPRGGGAAS